MAPETVPTLREINEGNGLGVPDLAVARAAGTGGGSSLAHLAPVGVEARWPAGGDGDSPGKIAATIFRF